MSCSNGRLPISRPWTPMLPEGLSGLYPAFLTRELGKDEPHWFDLYEPLLGLIAVAQGEGLTTEQLTDIIGKDIRAALRACKQYLDGELPAGPFRLFHKSLCRLSPRRSWQHRLSHPSTRHAPPNCGALLASPRRGRLASR